MKLPGINYNTTVQSRGQYDVGAPARVAAAEGRKAQAIAGAFNTAYEVYDEYDKQQAEEATKDNMLELQKRSLEFHKSFDEKDFYPSDHPYVTNTPEFEGDRRANIPAHEIRPAAYRTYMEESIEELSSNIHRKQYREDWRRDSESRLVDSVTRFTLESLRTRKLAYRQKLFDQIDEARQQRNYEMARTLADDDALTEDQRRDQNKETEWDEETDSYEGARLSEDPEMLQMKIDELEKGTYDGVLNPKEQRQYRDQLQSQLDSMTTRNTVQDSRERSVAIKDAKTVSEQENKGYLVDPAVHKTTRENLDRTGAKGTSADDLDESSEDMYVINKFSKTRLDMQKHTIDQLKQNEGMTPSQIRTVSKMEKAYQNNLNAVQNDVMAHAGKLGLIDIRPIVMDGTEDEFFGSILRRSSDYQEVKMILGEGNGMLSTPEAIQLSAFIKGTDAGTQAMLITTMYDHNPEVATELFEQLKVDDPSAYQSAANAFAEGRDIDASKILAGVPMISKMVDQDGSYNSKTVEQDIREEMASMYGTDYKAKESAVRAGVAIVAEAQSRGEVWDEGELDAENVVKRVTRGKIEVDGSYTVSPSSSKNERDVIDWKNSIEPEFIDKLTDGHGVDGMTNEEFVYKLEAGEFDWHYRAPGQWALTYENADGLDIRLQINNDTGESFILEFDESAAGIPGVRDRTYLEEEGILDVFSPSINRLKPEYRTNPDVE